MLLQTVLKDKAQIYAALSVANCANYITVKLAIPKIYGLVPEKLLDNPTLSFLVKRKPILTDGVSQKMLKLTIIG